MTAQIQATITLLRLDKASKTVSKVPEQLVSLAIGVMAVYLVITREEVEQLLGTGYIISTHFNRYQYKLGGNDGSNQRLLLTDSR